MRDDDETTDYPCLHDVVYLIYTGFVLHTDQKKQVLPSNSRLTLVWLRCVQHGQDESPHENDTEEGCRHDPENVVSLSYIHRSVVNDDCLDHT